MPFYVKDVRKDKNICLCFVFWLRNVIDCKCILCNLFNWGGVGGVAVHLLCVLGAGRFMLIWLKNKLCKLQFVSSCAKLIHELAVTSASSFLLLSVTSKASLIKASRGEKIPNALQNARTQPPLLAKQRQPCIWYFFFYFVSKNAVRHCNISIDFFFPISILV